jgi:enamine deaminase RidA (YjgF/YER057c/UK114 family)
MDIIRINPSPLWSDATIFNHVAHFVEVPSDTSLAFKEQFIQLLNQADTTLLALKSDRSKLLSVTIYLTNFDYLQDMNLIWAEWLTGCGAPSRACVKVELANPAMLIEIAFVAAIAG